MKYALALIASLMTTSFALEMSSIDPIDSQDLEINWENVKQAAETVMEKAKNLFDQYNFFANDEHSITSNIIEETKSIIVHTEETINTVSTALPLNDSSESSLFTTLKSYVVTRPYKIGVATVTATAALVGSVFYVYSGTTKKSK
ncbi:MAG: hypothetical protein M1114_02340 [Candidatus Dependentiae bacterium]|nr:hypothetical protein [Candidatus Dependentiae bacterium]